MDSNLPAEPSSSSDLRAQFEESCAIQRGDPKLEDLSPTRRSLIRKTVTQFRDKVEKFCGQFDLISEQNFASKTNDIRSILLQSVELELDLDSESDSDESAGDDDDSDDILDVMTILTNQLIHVQTLIWKDQKAKNEAESFKIKKSIMDLSKKFEQKISRPQPNDFNWLAADSWADEVVQEFSTSFHTSEAQVKEKYVKELRGWIFKIQQNFAAAAASAVAATREEEFSKKEKTAHKMNQNEEIGNEPLAPQLLPGVAAPVKMEIEDDGKNLNLPASSHNTKTAEPEPIPPVSPTLIEEVKGAYRTLMGNHFKLPVYFDPRRLASIHAASSKQAIEEVAGILSQKSGGGYNYDPKNHKMELYTVLEGSFKEFESRNRMNAPTSFAIGIDLGTTYSCVGVYINGRVEIIPNSQGQRTTPSFVSYTQKNLAGGPPPQCEPDDFEVTVGEEAKAQAHTFPEQTIYEVKRLIGRKFDDPVIQEDIKKWPFRVIQERGVPKILIGDKKTFHPEEVSAQILLKMKETAESYLNQKVYGAVITVPAYFTEGQRLATKNAGEAAGLQVLRIINEPTAAAIAYNLNWRAEGSKNFSQVTKGQLAVGKGRKGLVFDMGGGTFDVALFRAFDGKIEILKVGGDPHLGGVDFDNQIVQFCLQSFLQQHRVDLITDRESKDHKIRAGVNRKLMRLKGICERQKKSLSTQTTTNISMDCFHGQLDLDVQLSRGQFEALIAPLIQKALTCVENLLSEEAHLQKSDIEDIVLVGGSTRIPFLRKRLIQFFDGEHNKVVSSDEVDPDEAVAIGAAYEAAVLNGARAEASGDIRSAAIAPKGISIKDVTPMSLGVEVEGGQMFVLIPRQSQVPTEASNYYTTSYNNQTSVQIVIYEGEKGMATENSLVGEFYLNGIPEGLAGAYRVKVTMRASLEGIVQVTATCEDSGVEKQLTVRVNKQRMSAKDIESVQKKNHPVAAW